MRTRLSGLTRREFTSMLAALGLAWTLPVKATGNDLCEETLAHFVDVLIPEDTHAPAASALGVHRQIWQLTRNDPLMERFIRQGCFWLDRQSRGSFAALPPLTQQKLVNWMANQPDTSYPFQLFNRLRHESMGFYYSHPESWNGLPINQPPQPLGYSTF